MARTATDAGAKVVYSDSLTPTASHRSYMGNVRRRLGRKRGFWRFATERFFFIDDFMTQLGLTSALHLESDNLIFFDPAEVEETLKSLYPGLAAPFWNDTLCIPGVVYIGNRATLAELTAYLARRVAAERQRTRRWYLPRFLTRVRMGLVLHDMNMLAAFKREYGPDKLNILPVVPPDYDVKNDRVPHTYNYAYGFEELRMVFDALALGPALSGLDPTQHTVAEGEQHVRENSYVDGKAFGYERLNLRDHSMIPYLTFRGRPVRLASIHNHAKAQIV
jgi:hypothetical protein